jgi:hypothetical protein
MLERPISRREARRRRDARHRARVRAGIAIAPVPYTGEIVNALVRWNLLGSEEVHSCEEIGLAISDALADAAKH